jgi:hypothetical protein
VVICYIFPRFGILYQEKSGNPGHPAAPGLVYVLLVQEIDVLDVAVRGRAARGVLQPLDFQRLRSISRISFSRKFKTNW